MKRLARALAVRSKYDCGVGYRVDGMTALALLLRRLAFPCRLKDLLRLFRLKWSVTKVGRVIHAIAGDLARRFGPKVQLSQALFKDADIYAKAIARQLAVKGMRNPPRDLCGFVDGSRIEVCRPMRMQDVLYSGYKKNHNLLYQIIALPNGLIVSANVFPGRYNDAKASFVSELDALVPAGYRLLADSGYGKSRSVLALDRPQRKKKANKHRMQSRSTAAVTRDNNDESVQDQAETDQHGGASSTQETLRLARQRRDRKALSSVRTAVEDVIGQWKEHFKAMYYSKQLRTLGSPNCLACLHPNLVARRFGVPPPPLELYLSA
ncbi:hypothetical protein PTSG_06271 [Salpingoeca rosetta]|uniref:DDE Tnp4 domain-containing protein n=1 Tax=Salpingoeca rosetta (strain ATCC 50818 / BSB-021) TaxID=946362 RepID=F2UCF2_SALR5|nr:uncharacterized protein PTSG_06271 [Salpingoeca rosetta]EGD74259.1 hypothetical protein PTSG_06271 [Salpingoeca rosetta]|eukprot:XP_004993159.1 hypothetical protein PTSG_06271 [Salpingoeca rosetta]